MLKTGVEFTMPQIKKMIVHNLNLGGNQPVFSDELINLNKLENGQGALNFFTDHIQNNRSQSQTKRCKFKDNRNNILKNIVVDLYNKLNEDNFDEIFIEKSKDIADHLANSMRNKSSSNGSVFILLYTFEGKYNIGILKMDPNLGIEVNDDLSLTVRSNMLPGVKERLHKSAFILLQNTFEDNQTHLYALDRQQTKDEPAKYFMHDFLEAVERANNDNLTVEIQRELKKEICSNITSLEDRAKFISRLNAKFMTNEEFNIDEDLPVLTRGILTEGYPIEDSISMVKQNVLRKYSDATFSFIPNPQKVKETIYKSDSHNVTIKIDSSLENNLYEFYIDNDTDQAVFKFSPVLNIQPKS